MLDQTKNPTFEEPFNYAMMYFTSMNDDGLRYGRPTGSCTGLKGFDADAFIESAGRFWRRGFSTCAKKDEFLKKMAAHSSEKTRFGVGIRGEDVYRVISLKDKSVMDSLFGNSIAEEHKPLRREHFALFNP